jgi:hypothetical protein
VTRRYDTKERNTNAGPLCLLAAATESDGAVNQEMFNRLLHHLTLTLSLRDIPLPLVGEGASLPACLPDSVVRAGGVQAGVRVKKNSTCLGGGDLTKLLPFNEWKRYLYQRVNRNPIS